MKYLLQLFLLSIVIFFNACHDKSSNYTQYEERIDISGIAVDNYIKDATVCIDTNRNNDCSDELNTNITSTDENGSFIFSNIVKTDNMVIIAYTGRDIKTNESFNYILKNLVENTDENNKVVLSSLNTLITDYKFESNTTLEESTNAIINFLGAREIDKNAITSDIIANQDTYNTEFLRSLKLFQMVEKLNNEANVSNDFTQSAISFQAISQAILRGSIRHDDSNLTVYRVNKNLNASLEYTKPVFMDIPNPKVKSGTKKIFDLDFVVDPNGETIVYTLENEDDSNIFEIVKNGSLYSLYFKSTPIFNDNETNSYAISLNASNGHNFSSKNIIIDVIKNDISVPNQIVTNSFTILENSTNIGTIEIKNQNSSVITYSILGEDANDFILNSSSGEITLKSDADFELKSIYYFSIKVSDTLGNSNIKTISVNIENVDDAPTIITDTFTILNNSTKVGILEVKNSDNDILTYTLSGDDANYFHINASTGELTLLNPSNYENKSLYTIRIIINDNNSHETTQDINIIVSSPTEGIEIITTSFNINENTTEVGILSVLNPKNSVLTYTISGEDASLFNINSSTGSIEFISSPDFELKSSYNIVTTVTDSLSNSTARSISIKVLNVDDAPTILTDTISILENTIQVGSISIANSDSDSLSYTLTGIDENDFNINTSTGEIRLKSDANYEVKSSYSFIINVSDGTYTSSKTILLNISDVNDAPRYNNLTNISVLENTSIVILTVDASDDENDPISFSINDTTNFNINSSTGELKFNPTNLPDYEVKELYTLVISVSDGNTAINKTIQINILNINDNSPIFTSASSNSVSENQNFAITLNANDADGDSINYSISSADSASFDINISTGVINFNTLPDYENKNLYTFIAKASDGVNETTQNITINIIDLNDNAPTDIILSNSILLEGNTANNIVGTLSANDNDTNNIFTYSLAGTDSDSFTIINNNELKINIDTNYSVKSSYLIDIDVNDSIHIYSKNIIISIRGLDANGSFISTPITSINQNEYYDYTSQAVISDATLTYNEGSSIIPIGFTSTLSGENTDSLDIQFLGTPEDADVGVHTFKVYVDTNNSTSFFEEFNLTVVDVNDAPKNNTVLDNRTVDFGLSTTYTFDINDGDQNQTQNITVDIISSDLSVIDHNSLRTVDDSNGSFSIVFTPLSTGDANITVVLKDDGGVSNSGDDNSTYTFTVKSRASGWKIYEDNNVSDPTTPVVFDEISYDWNSSALWYETNSTILLPIKFLDDAEEGDYLGTNVNNIAKGHYDVNKSDYIYDDTVYDESSSETYYAHETKQFPNALDQTLISAKNTNFAHDSLNNLFVSIVSIVQKSYDDFQNRNYCADYYGNNWRLVSALDVGNNDKDSEVYGQYIGAYVGDTEGAEGSPKILTSTIDANEANKVLNLQEENALWDFMAKDTAENFRCVYNK